MPYTLNGIGTHYYGRRNASAVHGTCPHCNRAAQLSSYDTTECFCVLFIPLIPIKKYRIESECSSCRRHYRIPLEQFNANVDAHIKPLRFAVQSNPGDASKREELIRELMAAKLNADAETEARDAAIAFPNNDELNYLAGILAELRADLSSAEAWYRRTIAANAQHGGARMALGRVLAATNRKEEAVRELQAAVSLDGKSVGSLYLLATSLMDLGRWQEAYTSIQRIMNLDVAYTRDRDLLRKFAECKKKLGYELTHAEKKASRRWWPFGGSSKRKPVIAQGAGGGVTNWKAVFVALAIIFAVAIIGVSAGGWYKQSHVSVWFDNATGRALTMSVDGDTFEVRGRPPVERTLAPGKHVVRVLDGGKELERENVTVEEQELFSALFEPRFYVYNTSGAGIYARSSITYATEEKNQSMRSDFIAMRRWLEQADADYIFVEPPHSIEVSESTGTATKVVFDTANVSFQQLAYYYANNNKQADAQKVLEYAVSLAPCDASANDDLVTFRTFTGGTEAALAQAKQWVAKCDSDIAPHRTYQNLMRVSDQTPALVAAYRDRVAAAPTAANHYLYGRMLNGDAAIAEFTEALRLDPKLTWPPAALGYEYLALERDADAYATFSEAMTAPDVDAFSPYYFAMAAVATHREDDALQLLNHERKHLDANVLWSSRVLLSRAKGDYATAKKLVAEQIKKEGPEAYAALIGELDRESGTPTDTAIAKLAARKETSVAANVVAFHDAVERGDIENATRIESTALRGEDGPTMNTLYAVEAAILRGATDSGERLRALRAELAAKNDPDHRTILALVDGINGTLPADTLLLRLRESSDLRMLKHGFFALGVGAAMRGNGTIASAYFRKAAARALDREFPYRYALQLAGTTQTAAK